MRSLIFLFLSIPFFFACEPEEVSTIITSEERELPEFTKFELDDLGDAEIIISDEYKVIITTHVDILDDVKTIVRDGELEIELKGRYKNIKKLSYQVFVPYLDRIELDGVGNIRCYDLLESNNLSVYQNDVGNIELRDISAHTVYAKLDGVGDIELSGDCDQVALESDGVGNIHAFGLQAFIGDADLDGVGDIEINASEKLTIRNDGVGKVYYIGDPELHVSGNGSGIIKK